MANFQEYIAEKQAHFEVRLEFYESIHGWIDAVNPCHPSVPPVIIREMAWLPEKGDVPLYRVQCPCRSCINRNRTEALESPEAAEAAWTKMLKKKEATARMSYADFKNRLCKSLEDALSVSLGVKIRVTPFDEMPDGSAGVQIKKDGDPDEASVALQTDPLYYEGLGLGRSFEDLFLEVAEEMRWAVAETSSDVAAMAASDKV